MNGFSSGRDYIMYKSWQPNSTDTTIFDVFIDDSVTGARLMVLNTTLRCTRMARV